MTDAPKILKKVLVTAKGGELLRISHMSSAIGIPMTFALFLPKDYKPKTPLLFWLSGLTCDDTNFSMKAGPIAFAAAEEKGMAIILPDTSPRGEGVPNVDSYDLGVGAGFYVNATEEPYSKHYKMYDYVTDELPSYVFKHWPDLGPSKSIFGHSMGGHGALTIALKDPSSWVSVSAFSPICNPTACPWGEKAFTAYLGSVEKGKAHDATILVGEASSNSFDSILIDQGTADEFLPSQLKPEAFEEAAKKASVNVQVNMREGFDHSYYFIAAFVEDHINFHAKRLLA